jgi:hypothetical protein
LADGTPSAARLRVTRPHALVMLKLLALYDRYHNIRGPEEARHDREEAETHAEEELARCVLGGAIFLSILILSSRHSW